MAITIRELLVKIGLDVDAQSFAKGQIAVDLVRAGLSKIIDTGAEVARSFVEQIQATAEYGHELERTSQIVGLTTDELQRLNKGASVAGVGVDSLSTSLRFLSRNMSEAKQGGEEQAKVFAHAGVAYKDSTGKLRSAGDVITDVSTKFAKMEDGAEKTALAMQLFGRGGAELIPMLNLGGAELEKIGATANIISEEQIKAGVELVRTQKALEAQTKALWRGAVAPLLPAVTDLLKQFLAWKKANNELLKQRIQGFLKLGIDSIRALGKAFDFATTHMRIWTAEWKAAAKIIAPILAGWILYNSQLIASFVAVQAKAAWAARSVVLDWVVAAAPFVVLGALIAVIAAGIDEIATYRRGLAEGFETDTIFDKYQKQIDEWLKPNNKDPFWLKWAKDLVFYLEQAVGLTSKLTRQADAKQGKERAKLEEETPWYLPSVPRGSTQKEDEEISAKARRSRAIYERYGTWAQIKDVFGGGDIPRTATPEQIRAGDLGGAGVLAPVTVNNQFSITQLAGESGEDLARRVADIVEEQRQSEYSAAAAALPAVQ